MCKNEEGKVLQKGPSVKKKAQKQLYKDQDPYPDPPPQDTGPGGSEIREGLSLVRRIVPYNRVLMYGQGQITTRAGSLVLSSHTHKIPIRTPAKNSKDLRP
jgi:hypothetical protein